MLESWLNIVKKDSFQEGLKLYIQSHKFNNAATDDLWAALTVRSGGENVKELMDFWTKKPGYPVVFVEHESDGKVYIRQQRFMVKCDSACQQSYYMVPVHYAKLTNSVASADVKLNANGDKLFVTSISRTTSSEAIVLNSDRRGFYRVKYPDHLVDRLIADANATNPLQSANDVIGLMDDMWRFSHSDLSVRVKLDQLLTFCKVVAMNKKFHSEPVMYKSVETLLMAGDRGGHEDQADAFVNRLIEPTLDDVYATNPLTHDQALLKAFLLTVAVKVKNAKYSQRALEDWRKIKSGNDDVPADNREAAYHAAMLADDEANFRENYEWLMKHYMSHKFSSYDRTNALYSVAYCSDESIVSDFLKDSLNLAKVRAQDTSSVIIVVSRVHRELAWEFLKTNYDVLKTRYEKQLFSFTNLVSSVATSVDQQESRDEVEKFLSSKAFDPKILPGILETIDATLNWRTAHGDEVHDWFERESM